MNLKTTLLSLASIAALTLPATSQSFTGPQRLILDPTNSNHLEGCYDPCDCLLALFPGVRGKFDLIPAGFNNVGDILWDVENLEFRIPNVGVARGSGVYRHLPTALVRHRMELMISINNGLPVAYDSGVQIANNFPPPLEIAVADNDFFCFNRVFEISAVASVGEPFCEAGPTSTGLPARICARGSASVAQNNLVLKASPLPPGQPGLFYFGPVEIADPFGNGIRCVGGSTNRLFPVTFAVGAEISHALDLSQAPGNMIAVGDTVKFQAWFRDPAGGMPGFDLSDGLSVTFEP